MTELENKLVEKILEKLNMEELTDKIAEKAAELIVRKEYPKSPWIEPFKPNPYEPFGPVMYGVPSTEFRPYTTTPYVTTSTTSTFVDSKTAKEDETRR